jgi:Rrf2 family protein
MRLELTRRTDYAVRAALVLAGNPGETVSGSEIARQTQIPVRFVTRVMTNLVRSGMVSAVIGRSGGYRLNGKAASVSVLAIVEAVEGIPRRTQCALRAKPCPGATTCEIHHVFVAARESFVAELARWTLASVAAGETT